MVKGRDFYGLALNRFTSDVRCSIYKELNFDITSLSNTGFLYQIYELHIEKH